MKRFAVDSSNLLEVGYDLNSKTLEVVFVSDPRWVYTYQKIPMIQFVRLITAESVGVFFNKEIRSKQDKFPYSRRKVKV